MFLVLIRSIYRKHQAESKLMEKWICGGKKKEMNVLLVAILKAGYNYYYYYYYGFSVFFFCLYITKRRMGFVF